MILSQDNLSIRFIQFPSSIYYLLHTHYTVPLSSSNPHACSLVPDRRSRPSLFALPLLVAHPRRYLTTNRYRVRSGNLQSTFCMFTMFTCTSSAFTTCGEQTWCSEAELKEESKVCCTIQMCMFSFSDAVPYRTLVLLKAEKQKITGKHVFSGRPTRNQETTLHAVIGDDKRSDRQCIFTSTRS